MNRYTADRIRNVVLLAHSGAGKTSLAEAILFTFGAISRLGRVTEGTTASDFEPEETKRRISLSLALLPCETPHGKLNLLDAPGYFDFWGEVVSGLRVADGAVVVVDAAAGVEVGTELCWKALEEARLPRLVLCNKMDRENADFLRTLEQLRDKFGRRCVPLHFPLGAQASFRGVVDLVTLQAHLRGGETGPVPEDVQSEVEGLREQLLETVVEMDDELMARYLEGETLSEEEIRTALRQGVLRGAIVPVLAGSGLQNVGIGPLVQAVFAYLPAPSERPAERAHLAQGDGEIELPVSEEGPLAALVFKTTADPFVGKLTYFKVFSGVLRSDSQVWNSTKGRPERIGQLYLIRGKTQEPVAEVPAGDLGGVAKLAETGTGDTLSSREQPIVLSPPTFPSPVLAVAVHPKSKADLDKMGSALARIVEEDPTLAIRREPDTHETLLLGLGETHVEVAAERMRRKFGAEVVLATPKVPYKETITRKTQAEYRHRKQTGGHGQYGHVFLEFEPLPRGAGFQFEDRIVGGVVPKQYIPGVEKGVLEALQEGPVAGYPVVDLKVALYDGSYHPVDSSDISFQIAAAYATRRGLTQAGPVLLEPIYLLRVTVPDAFVGDIMTDLNGKRARVLGTNPQDGVTIIEAQVPLAEVQRYATDLRAITQGRGTFTMEFSHYEEVPAHITQRIVAEAKKEPVRV